MSTSIPYVSESTWLIPNIAWCQLLLMYTCTMLLVVALGYIHVACRKDAFVGYSTQGEIHHHYSVNFDPLILDAK